MNYYMSIFQVFCKHILSVRWLVLQQYNVVGVLDVKYFIATMLLISLSACQSENVSYHNVDSKKPTYLYSPELRLVRHKTKNTHSTKAISANTLAKRQENITDSDTEQFYHGLLAELYLQRGDNNLAADEYLLASKLSTDKHLLKKATVLAATTGKNQQALEIAKRWEKLEIDSLEAKQYKTLLLLRTDHYADSAKMLREIKQFVAHESKNPVEGAQFVSQLLSLETHHQQAYKTYRVYLKEYGEKTAKKNNTKKIKKDKPFDLYEHQKITLATLAMKTKRYKVVTSVLKNIPTERAVLLRSKALNKLGRTRAAVSLLKPWLDKKTTGDGLRFEYVRFSIISGEKAEATRVLQKLVEKHKDNKDLLKSLVALNLDQKKWDLAERSAEKLMAYKDYRSDANHFMGEIYQARGDNDLALKSYQKVVDGQLMKSALKRIPVLIEKQQGISAARLWLHKQRISALNHAKRDAKSNKQLGLKTADLYKIEGDLLFADKAFDSALNYYQRALALVPDNTDIRYSRALAYEQQGKIKQAENDLKLVLRKKKNDPVALNALGYMLAVHTERLDEAMLFIKKAQKISPDDAAINDSLGWLHYRRGEIKTAEHYLRKSYQAVKQPDVASHLIQVLQKRGQKQEAKIILYQMLRQYPDDKKLKGLSIN